MAGEFRFNTGRLALALPATVRRRASLAQDVLARPGAPARWLREAGLVAEPLTLSPAQERELLMLRKAVQAIADAVVAGDALPRRAVGVLNMAAAHPIATPQLDAKSGRQKQAVADPFEAAIAAIARDAIDLVSGPLRERIKACEQDDCRVLFLDTSRSARRRWCSMDRCGSRAKGEAFRQRHKKAG
ncbi:MAG TPA: ABATE domain-containing protein [Alphaproteobacteria bacterium]|nr:ABATE domain-containing protein [Alphaproteobacteria bacterium]